MTVLREKKAIKISPKKESAQDRAVGHRAGVKLCEGFFIQAYKSREDVASLRDLLAGLLDGCNEVLLKFAEKNQFKNGSANNVISQMSITLDDSFTEIQKIRV